MAPSNTTSFGCEPQASWRGRPLVWWLALRPAFFSVTVVAVLLGVAIAAAITGRFPPGEALGAGVIALMLAVAAHGAANVINDYHDQDTDAHNHTRRYPFTGGSRFLQNGVLTPREVAALGYGLLAATIAGGALLAWWRAPLLFALGAFGLFLAWAYSAPPLRLSARGLGEVAIALAWAGVVAGSALIVAPAAPTQPTAETAALPNPLPLSDAPVVRNPQPASDRPTHLNLPSAQLAGEAPVPANHPLPTAMLAQAFWLGLPYGLLVANILFINQFPDAPADARAGKRTWPVRLGARAAAGYGLILALATLSHLAAIASGQLPALTALALLALLPGLTAARRLWRVAPTLAAPHPDFAPLEPAIRTTIAVALAYGKLTALTISATVAWGGR